MVKQVLPRYLIEVTAIVTFPKKRKTINVI
jgi:hypothetical protein